MPLSRVSVLGAGLRCPKTRESGITIRQREKSPNESDLLTGTLRISVRDILAQPNPADSQNAVRVAGIRQYQHCSDRPQRGNERIAVDEALRRQSRPARDHFY